MYKRTWVAFFICKLQYRQSHSRYIALYARASIHYVEMGQMPLKVIKTYAYDTYNNG